MKKAEKQKPNINSLITVLYMCFVLLTGAFTSITKADFSLRSVYVIAVALGIFALCPLYIKKVKNTSVKNENNKLSVKGKAALFFAVFAFFIFSFVVWFPGGWTVDSVNQLNQALSNHYNDWHPVFQTIATIKIPLILTGGWYGAPTLFQIIAFSAAITYALCTVYELTNKKVFLISFAFIMLNPNTSCLAVMLWKDTSFAILALLLTVYSLKIFFSRGEWIKKPVNAAALTAVSVAALLVRHNAVLFVFPLLLAIFLIVEKKRGAAVLICVIVLFVGVKYPVYSALNVEKPGQRAVETMGLPISIIGNAVKETPELLDSETLEFAYGVAPKEIWEEEYVINGFNSVKFNKKTNLDFAEKYGAKNIVGIMIKTVKNSPSSALSELFYITGTAYSISNDYSYRDMPYVAKNSAGIKLSEKSVFQGIRTALKNYSSFCILFLPHLFMYAGVMHLILLITALSKIKINKQSIRRYMLIIPAFVYNFGTALLLTGTGDASRFFYYTFLITPLLLVLIFKEEKRLSER